MSRLFEIKDLRDCSEHLETLCDWHHKQWAYLNPGQTWSDRLELMKADLEDRLVPSTFVALDGDRLLGSAAILSEDMDIYKELSPWLASVYVAPEYRSQGIGEALVRHVMSVAETNAVKTLYLYTPDAESYYMKMGWQIFRQLDYHGEDVTIMSYSYDY